MKKEISKGNLLYDIDDGIIKELPATRLQLPKGINSSDSNITDSKENVKLPSSNIMQDNQENITSANADKERTEMIIAPTNKLQYPNKFEYSITYMDV